MKRMFYSGLVAVAVLVALFSATGTARADAVFDMFSVANDTDNPVNYQVSWDGGRWETFCVPAHSSWNHWCKVTCHGHSAEIRFDRGENTGDISYSLTVYRGTSNREGASYTIAYQGQWLDLTKND